MKKQYKKDFVKCIIGLILLVILVLTGLFLYKFTDRFTVPLKSTYIVFNDKIVLSELDDIQFNVFDSNVIGIKSLLGNSTTLDYQVEVIPISTIDFDFYSGVNVYKYSDITTLTKAFKIVKSSDSFVITVIENNMQKILTMCTEISNIEVPSLNQYSLTDYFTLLIKVNGDEFKINFHMNSEISGVEIDTEEIII